MLERVFLVLSILGMTALAPSISQAQGPDMSPTLLLESGPSDVPGYRRMVHVKYLSGDRITASYVAYNRSEFRQIQDNTPVQAIQACSRGPATGLNALRAFQQAEAERARRGQAPESVRFCIKGVSGWEAGNKDRYTDPVFEGMPFAASRR